MPNIVSQPTTSGTNGWERPETGHIKRTAVPAAIHRLIHELDMGSPSGVRCGSWRQRKPEREAAAFAGTAFHGHAPAVGFSHMTDEGQPDATAPSALSLAPPNPVELVEDPRLLLAPDPDALISNT